MTISQKNRSTSLTYSHAHIRMYSLKKVGFLFPPFSSNTWAYHVIEILFPINLQISGKKTEDSSWVDDLLHNHLSQSVHLMGSSINNVLDSWGEGVAKWPIIYISHEESKGVKNTQKFHQVVHFMDDPLSKLREMILNLRISPDRTEIYSNRNLVIRKITVKIVKIQKGCKKSHQDIFRK